MLPNLGEIWLATLLADFHQRYPDIEIVLIEATTLPFENLLVRGQLNVALLHQMPTGLPSTLVSYPLFTDALVLAVNADHPLATQSQVSLADLHDENPILVKAGSAIREVILNAMTAAGFTPHIVCESGSLSTITALVVAGLGITILPGSAVRVDQTQLRAIQYAS